MRQSTRLDADLSAQAQANPRDVPLEQIDVTDPTLFESDPPVHDDQRRAVEDVVAPRNLAGEPVRVHPI
jgi:hypothetical protein